MSTNNFDLSIIIPIYNEIEIITNIKKLINQLLNSDRSIEILFIDGGSTDGTLQWLLNCKRIRVIQSEKGRGNQLVRGVKESKSNNLLFLHADSRFAKNPVQDIMNQLENYLVGAFELYFYPTNIFLKLVSWKSNCRMKKNYIIFGDQGMFIRRDFYYEVGGFKEIEIMEDYEFSLRLKKYLKQKKEKIGIARQSIGTSSRFFEKNGYLFSILKMQYCQYLFRIGEDIDKIKKVYNK